MFTRKLYVALFLAAGLLPAVHAQFLQQGSKLIGSGSSGSPSQGWTVALSADGNTAIEGGYFDGGGAGAAWVFTRTNGVWSQQGPKLLPSPSPGAAGYSVAISADGNTAVAGGNSATIFTRTNGVWSQQGPSFGSGRSVGISGDGNTVIAGVPGSVGVFTRTNGVWTQQGSNLIGTGGVNDPVQGVAVGLSSDGNTAIVGGDNDNGGIGTVWIFTRSNGAWTQQGPKLVGTGVVGPPVFQGISVGLSADGNTAVVGGTADNLFAGAAWVFTRANGAWTQQGPKLVGTGAAGNANQAYSVAISGDGNTILSGGYFDAQGVGAGWVFTRANGVWTQFGSKLVGTGGVVFPGFTAPAQGRSAALSSDGHTAILGGPNDQPAGSIWVFVSAPLHFAVSAPASVTAGNPFSFTVTALDPNNAVLTGYTGTVHFSTTDPIGNLPGDATLTNGVGTFTAILKSGGLLSPTITANDTVNSSILGTSAPIVVQPGAASSFVFSATPPTVVSGVPFSFIVSAFDSFGNFMPSNTARVHFTSSDGAAVLPGDSLMPGGVATFSAILKTLGNQTITVTDTSNSSITGTSNLIAVTGSSTITNLSVGKQATQSSTALVFSPTTVASSAVDGNTDGNFYNGSVTATTFDNNAWWQVDLGFSASISSIVIWNRTDCCGTRLGDYWVFVSDTPFGPTDTVATLQNRAGTFSSHQTTAPNPSATITITGAQGRYVRVQLTGFGFLSLAEVQVFGTPGGSSGVSLAMGKTATESSTLPGYAGAGSAVDGIADGNFFNGSVTATNLDTNAWWQVDLGASATINSVVVWNRTDCCGTRLNDYWVFVSNIPFLPTDTPDTLQNRPGTFSSHQMAAPNPSAAIVFGGTAGVFGQYIRVQLTGTGYLSLAEVQVFGSAAAPGPTNVALGKPATQSSTLAGYASDGAQSAVDGNPNGNFFGGSVTATNLDNNAWWQVDLGTSVTVGSMVIWNRTDCCGTRLNDYWVFISDTPFLATDTPATLQSRAGTFSSHQMAAPNPSTTIAGTAFFFPSIARVAAQGRYVRVQLTGANYLSLAEVQVFGQ